MGSAAQDPTWGARLKTRHGERGSRPDMGSAAQDPTWGGRLKTRHGERGSRPDMGSAAQDPTWAAWVNTKCGVSVVYNNDYIMEKEFCMTVSYKMSMDSEIHME